MGEKSLNYNTHVHFIDSLLWTWRSYKPRCAAKKKFAEWSALDVMSPVEGMQRGKATGASVIDSGLV
jgi:hypothetical protein